MADDYLKTFEARGHEYNAAVSFCPDAREAERQAVLDLLDCQPGQTILDAPAGGGYVAEGLNERMASNVTILCVEPSARFAAGIGDHFVTKNCPLDNTNLGNQSVDGVVSLAGLHHVSDKRSIYREWERLIKPGGRLAIGDVGIDTGTGSFLNEFVNQHTPGGHDGVFLAAEELFTQLAECGLQFNSAILQEVPWQFPDRVTLGKFCKSLFGVESASAAETADALESYVGTNETDSGYIQLNWQLLFAVAEKPSI
jgi:ubiquinone/menaquinone biosynthesis C-methylase UbiE